jgi:hypothetical protein
MRLINLRLYGAVFFYSLFNDAYNSTGFPLVQQEIREISGNMQARRFPDVAFRPENRVCAGYGIINWHTKEGGTMRILAVNDDGWRAEGIKALVKELAGNHEVWLAAPELEHSATSHSTTFFHDMVVDRIDYPAPKAPGRSGAPRPTARSWLLQN